MKKVGFVMMGISLFCSYIMLTRSVFADECPPAGGGSSGSGASSLFGGGVYSLMSANNYGVFVYTLFALLLLLFVLLSFFLIKNRQSRFLNSA